MQETPLLIPGLLRDPPMNNAMLMLLMNPFPRWRVINQYYSLRRDIFREMPWTIEYLKPVVNPYLPSE